MSASVAVLFARRDSLYKHLPECDVWDADRDAWKFPGGMPVIARPPCGQWGRLAYFAHVNLAEKWLGFLAVELVQRWGGVLEHPAGSSLWDAANLPKPPEGNTERGFTIVVDQLWFGHRCAKRTWLYICGFPGGPENLPPHPFHLGYPTRSISTSQRSPKRLPEISRKERELTPLPLAEWLVKVAGLCLASDRSAVCA